MEPVAVQILPASFRLVEGHAPTDEGLVAEGHHRRAWQADCRGRVRGVGLCAQGPLCPGGDFFFCYVFQEKTHKFVPWDQHYMLHLFQSSTSDQGGQQGQGLPLTDAHIELGASVVKDEDNVRLCAQGPGSRW